MTQPKKKSSKLAPRHKPPAPPAPAQGASFTRWLAIYGAYVAGILTAAALAYWYYVQHYEDPSGVQ